MERAARSRRRAFYDARSFPEVFALRQHWPDICREARLVCATLSSRLESAIGPQYVVSLIPEPEDRTETVEELSRTARDLAPLTTRLVSDIGYVVSFAYSRIGPGGHIPSHEHWNPNVVAALCLQGGGHSHIVVGGERQDFQDGEIVVFDYTLPHESHNEGEIERLVLLMVISPKLARAGLGSRPALTTASTLVSVLQAAEAQLGAGDPQQVAAILSRLAAEDRSRPEVRLLAGRAALAQGDNAQAQRDFEAGLAAAPGHVQLLLALAQLQAQEGLIEPATLAYRRAVQVAPGIPAAQAGLGQLLLRRGDFDEAILCLAKAAVLDPGQAGAWLDLEEHLPRHPITQFGEVLQRALLIALRKEVIAPTQLPNTIALVVSTLPAIAQLAAWRQEGVLRTELERPAGRAALQQPLLLDLLVEVRWLGVETELTLRELRAWLLSSALAGASEHASELVPLAQALCAQCWHTDYAYYVSAQEESERQTLLAALQSAADWQHMQWLQALALSCYQPLSCLPDQAALRAYVATHGDATAKLLLRQQQTEPQRERELRSTLACCGTISDATSAAVQAQYEHSPYPRYTQLPDPLRATDHRAQPLRMAELVAHPQPRILVAGCGTGMHPLTTARLYPQAQVTGIDLSAASLAYAERKREEAGIHNLKLWQGDLLQVAELGQSFDSIECVGVLHHLRDPEQGLRALCAVLKPGGLLRLGLYSAQARRDIRTLRARLAAERLPTDDASLRSVRFQILNDPSSEEHRRIVHWPDFYALAECRDLLFHVQEHQFTLAQIADLLAGCQLQFLHFHFPSDRARAAYQARFPDDTAMTRLDRWSDLEAQITDLFAGMYQFWARKPS